MGTTRFRSIGARAESLSAGPTSVRAGILNSQVGKEIEMTRNAAAVSFRVTAATKFNPNFKLVTRSRSRLVAAGAFALRVRLAGHVPGCRGC